MKIIETYIVSWRDGGGIVNAYTEYGKVHKTSDGKFYLERYNGKIRPLDGSEDSDFIILKSLPE